MVLSSLPQLHSSLSPKRRCAPAAVASLLQAMLLALLVGIASPAGAETTLDVETPAGEFGFKTAGTVVLLVTVAADGAADGDVVVAANGAALASERVEVPGGSSKTVVLTVPAVGWAEYEVRFVADSEEDSSAKRVELRPAVGDELVAVFDSLASRGMPGTADLTVDVGRARLFAFDSTLLDHGRDAMSVFGYAIAAREDLDRLSEPARDALWGWVALDGGSLVLAAEPGDVELPPGRSSEFAADDPRRAWLGSGEVLFVGDSLDEGYDGLLEPRASGLPGDRYWVDSWTRSGSLARDAGVTVPSIGVLVIALIAYAVLAGPVLWLLLRRSRREPLLWLVLPALALLVTGGVYIAGRQLREAAGSAHASMVVDVLGEQYRASYVLVTSPNGGAAGVTLVPGWSRLPIVDAGFEGFGFDGGFGFQGGFDSSSVARPDSDSRLLVDIRPGGFGIVGAQAETGASSSPAFAVSTSRDDIWLNVDLVNQSEYTLHQVVAGSSDSARRLSEPMAPGESRRLRLPLPSGTNVFADPLFEEIAWGGEFFMEEDLFGPVRAEESQVSPAIVADFLAANTHLRSGEYITVVGWTREPEAPLATHAGRPVTDGSTALMTVARLDPSGSEGANEVTMVRNHESTSVLDQSGGLCSEGPVTLRIKRVGGFASGESAVLDPLPRGVVGLDVWNGDSWVPARINDLDDDHVIRLPDGAVQADAVHVRLAPDCGAFGNNKIAPELRPLADDDVAVLLGQAEPEADGDAADASTSASHGDTAEDDLGDSDDTAADSKDSENTEESR